MSTVIADKPDKPEKLFFGQPRQLTTIFGVEMWERFSFYGMQGILLLYMFYPVSEGGLGIDVKVATGIVGAYGGGVYLATILGAWLADRMFGSERVLFYAAVMVMFGHIALAVLPAYAGLTVGLILIAIGAGGVKANATSIVGQLYAPGDVRRDAGFSLYYLGINLGAFVGPLATGFLQTTYGFHWGFGLAAVGMAAGLIQYTFGRRRLPPQTRVVPNPLPSSKKWLVWVLAAAGAAVIALLVLSGVITSSNLATVIIIVTAGAAIAYFIVILGSKLITPIERNRVLAFIPLFIACAAFWSLYQQQFTVVTIFANDQLDLNIFGWTMPVSWVQSINPIFILALSGIFAALWTKWGTKQPSTPVKMGLGTIVMGLAFLMFLSVYNAAPHTAPLLMLVGILFVFTIAELLISPVSLSVSTKLAPTAFRTQMVALLFLSSALGTAMSGQLAGLYDEKHPELNLDYFLYSGLAAIALGVVLLLIRKWVLKLMEGVR
ncbi:POT family proton-dependent oligopeptide transporter [Aurantimicrobium minutum]|uniref:peptide MFS transporter n=1 Tax=Aurantimicrobium minutum TaxID=708131 RepID=UPI002473CE03|nr:oligopeptide:H+ symporter [Aurantimicrobium minutum]MDH6532158.1 POT family proton-dependent oligopeptide transporter [Aurantimicrobium minutum]